MASHRFSVDCHEEEQRFRGLLAFGTRERVMAIRATGESGKSHFLQRCERVCRDADPPVPSSAVDFAVHTSGQPIELVRAIRKGFGKRLKFPRFDQLSRDLNLEIYTPVAGVIDARGAQFAGSRDFEMAAVVLNDAKGPVNVTASGAIKLDTEEKRQAVHAECFNAFFEELVGHCAEAGAVIILDTYEQCPTPAASWFEDEARERFAADLWPERLILLMAGRDIARFEEDWPQRQLDERVVMLDGFRPWQPEDIAEGFRELGHSDPPPLFHEILKFREAGATNGQLAGLMRVAAESALPGGR